MSNKKLIFVEGVCGSGKSTTAHLLSWHMNKHGMSSNWLYEHERNHPIFDSKEVDAARASIDLDISAFDQSLLNWKAYVESAQKNDKTVLMESTFLQTTVGTMIMMDIGRESIVEHVSKVADIVMPLEPTIIYFDHSDIKSSLRVTLDDRGEEFEAFLVGQLANSAYGIKHSVTDFQGVVKMFEYYNEVISEILENLKFEKIVLNNAELGWNKSNKFITDRLGLPAMPTDWKCQFDAGDYCGAYKGKESGETMQVSLHDGYLLAGIGDVGPLLHINKDSFQMLGVCIDIDFKRDSDNRITELESVGNVDNLEKSWVRVQ